MRKAYQNMLLILSGILMSIVLLELLFQVAAMILLLQSRGAVEFGSDVTILCLGESTTQMGGDDSWPSQLALRLNDAGEKTYSVINEGIPAMNTAMILARLDSLLAKYDPDIVVSMMGVNDLNRGLEYSFVRGRWKIPKVAKWIYDALNQKMKDKTEVKDLRILSDAVDACMLDPDRYESSVETLISYLDDPVHGARARVELAGCYTEKGYLKKAKEVLSEWGDVIIDSAPTVELTAKHYKQLNDMLLEKGIFHIAMQYPTLDSSILKVWLSGKDNTMIVENKDNFDEALAEFGYDKLFIDQFRPTFGHATAYGNKLIVDNLAPAILEVVS